MPDVTIIQVNPDDFLERIRLVVQSELQQVNDRPMSRREVAEMFGKSLPTIDKWIRLGKIRRINPEGVHPIFSYKEIINPKNNQPCTHK